MNKIRCLTTGLMVSPMLLGTVSAGLLMSSSTFAREAVLEEVIVSARKRDENRQSVPSSVDAFSAELIEQRQIQTIEDTYGSVPGLYFTGNLLSPNREFRQLVIRGVGANSQLEPSTATFVDGVYSPALGFDLNFLDLERVEVLKGPQGALFGRNTEAGALNIVTRKPNEEFRSRVYVEIDEFDTYEVQGSVSGALSESNQLFGKVAALYSETDGYIENNAAVSASAVEVFNNVTGVPETRAWTHKSESRKEQDEGKRYAITGSLVYAPTDALEFVLSADVSDYEGGDPSPGPLSSCECYEVNGDYLFDHDSENSGASLTVNWDSSIGTLTSISGWRRMESSTPWDFDGVSDFNGSPRLQNVHDFDSDQEILSQEFRLASDGSDTIHWLIGAYYFDETNDSDRFYNFPNLDDPGGAEPQQFLDGLWNQQIVNIDREGWAIFGQVTWDISEKIELAIGGRYSDEEAEVEALEAFAFPFAGFTGVTGVPDVFTSVDQGDWQDFTTPVSDSESWDNFSPSLSLKYSFNDNVMSYFSYAAGFKAGSYQKAPVTVADVAPVDPENVDSFEIGLKSTLLDGRMKFNAAVFYIELEDMQLQAAVERNGIISSAITNAAESEIKGFEASVDALLMENLTLSFNYGYTDSEFSDYIISPDGVSTIDRSGDSFPNTPEYTLGLSAEYVMPLSSDMDLVAFGNYRAVDETYIGSNSLSVDPIIEVPDWYQVDLKLSLQTSSWKLTAFVDNATDEYIVLTRWNPFFVEPGSQFVHDRVAPPRRVGLSFTYNFGQ